MSKLERANHGNHGRLLTNSYEQAAGWKSAPDSVRGALRNLADGKRFWCPSCQSLRTVTAIDSHIVQTPNAAIYDTVLNWRQHE